MGRSSGHNKDSKRYYDWMYHAHQDLLAARHLIENEDLYEPTVFHCQQAVEKSLKSFMLFKSHRLFDGHNITWLCKQAAMLNGNFTPYIEKTVLLNKFYIETRYPADIPTIITEEFAREMLDITEKIMSIACSALKFDYNSYHKRRVRS